ncbi:G-type lectin S-receptor-like serine/threonine-protein kinase [Panicum miliaceum]|uniref:Receptor-like serine/threonine-protein kinase n=1 Tax=Panicum miliaceum TaxID=4540 RepID=A0A3L6R9E9_PANMI|nr:G-type lectin S-receptor-like serine/threonine-protein kinase [Panicum miliaceum]
MAPLHVVLAGLVFFSSLHTAAPCSTATATGDTLAAGRALAAGDKLVSRNGKFALGFFRFRQSIAAAAGTAGNSTGGTTTTVSSSPGWYLGIWFNKIPVCTTVWIANRERPIAESELNTTQLRISTDGNLVIVSSNTTTESKLWSTEVVNSTDSVSALLNSTGNLDLLPETPSNGAPLWQSFDYPTDVGLPTAKIGRNKLTGFNRSFVSKKSLIDPGFGSYSIDVGIDGALRLTSRSSPPVVYWPWPAGRLAQLVQALDGLMDSDPRTKGLLKPTFQDDDEEVYFSYTITDDSASVFVLIDISGQLKLNVWSKAKESWETVYAQPSDFCIAHGVCGPFTVCNGNSAPLFCDCLETFSRKSPRDWDLGDRTGGCARNTPLDCSNRSKTGSTDVFHPVSRVKLPFNAQRIEDATTPSNCAEACLNDCSCTAYSYSNSKCSVWHGELLDVSLDDGIAITGQDALYLRLAARDFQRLEKKKNKQKSGAIVAATASIVSFGLLVLILLVVVWRNRFKWFNVPLHDTRGSGGIIAFRYIDLVRATKNFSERLGGGGFGSVFKGVLNESTTIAVKRLDGARQGEKQFRAEVSSIGLIQHINLVKLIGFCCEGDNRLLVYEHMSNGSLDAHLFQSNATILNWSTRYQIAIGVARGLCYLHQSCRECIIHCDIKPENILLDASFAPKIADFGMAAFVGRDFSRVMTTFRGTAGYLAPEWLSGVAITPKVDVYSFGMVLLEIISGKRNTPEVNSKSSYQVVFFPVQAVSKLHEGDLQSLVDPQLHGDFDFEEAERVCKVAFWCIQDNECDRPTMGEVVRVLEGLQELDMPPMPRLLAAITERSHAALL